MRKEPELAGTAATTRLAAKLLLALLNRELDPANPTLPVKAAARGAAANVTAATNVLSFIEQV
jgi:hypothetical protein